MGFIYGPCAPHYEDWEDAYDNWKEKNAAANKEGAKMGVGTGIALGVCAYIIWSGVATLPCIVVGAGALTQDASSISASLARNEAAKAANAARKILDDCMEAHKNYYGN